MSTPIISRRGTAVGSTTNATTWTPTWTWTTNVGTGTNPTRWILIVTSDGNPTLSVGAGSNAAWTKLGQASDGTAAVTQAIFVADFDSTNFGAGTIPTFNLASSASEQFSAAIYCMAANGPTQALAMLLSAAATGSSTNSDPPALTNTGGVHDILVFATRGGDSTVVATAPPAGYTTNPLTATGGGTSGASTNAVENTINNVAAGASIDPGTFTSATEQWVSYTIAIWHDHPVAAGAMATASPALDTPALGQKHVISTANMATAAPALGSPALGLPPHALVNGRAVGDVLCDNFNDNLRDVTIWNVGQNADTNPTTGTTVAETGGVLQVTIPVGTIVGNGYVSVADYVFDTAWATFDAAGITGAANHTEQFICFGDAAALNNYSARVWITGGVKKLSLNRKVAAGGSGVVGTALNYSATTHQWIRLRRASGNVYLDTAPSTASDPPIEADWVNRFTEAWDAGIPTTGKISLGASCWSTGSPATTVSFDKFGTTVASFAAIGTPTLGQVHGLTATALTVSSPVLATPAVGQKHVLTTASMATAAPVLGTPTMGAIHALGVNALTTGPPVLGTPTVTLPADNLTANALTTASPQIANRVPDGGFEGGLPSATYYADGGFTNLSIITGGAHGGSKFLRTDAIGGNTFILDNSTFVAGSKSALLSVWLKDSGLAGTWGAAGYPDQPHSLKFYLTTLHPSAYTFGDPLTVAGSGPLYAAPAAGSGWTQYTQLVTGLVPGTTYHVALQPNYYEGSRRLDIDDLLVTDTSLGQVHVLTAAAMATASPAIGTPAVGQKHSLTANAVATASPAMGTATLGQKHALTAVAVTTASPVPGTPVLGQKHALTATAVATSAPVLATPAVGQAHSLTATALATSAPQLGTPVLHVTFILTATSLATGAPQLGSPAVAQVHGLTATNLATASPALGSPAVGAPGTLFANSLVSGSPVLGNPVLGQAHQLVATGVTTASPAVGSPVLVQVHQLTGVGVTVGSPQLGTPAVAQVHALTIAGTTTASPVLGSPVLTAISGMVAANLTTGSPAMGSPALVQVHALTAAALVVSAPDLASPPLGVVFHLVANGVTIASPAMASPGVQQGHQLVANGVTSAAPVLGVPGLGQTHVLAAAALVTASPVPGSPALQQVHALTANGTTTGQPDIPAVVLQQAHQLAANSITAQPPILGSPAYGYVLVANDLVTASPDLATPVLFSGVIHVLFADDLVTSSPALDQPGLRTFVWSRAPEDRTVAGTGGSERIVSSDGPGRVVSSDGLSRTV